MRKGKSKPKGKMSRTEEFADKGKRGQRRGYPDDRPFRKDIAEGDMFSKGNDPAWYAADPQLLRDAASFPYSWPLGGQFDLGALADNFDVNAIPGIMAIYTAPAFGWSDNPNSPVNVAARNIFTYVRHANSGSWNYNAPDLMLYLLAMDSAFSYIAYLKRVYGVAATYSVTNRYYPRALVEAMGVDFEDLQKNFNDFRGAINLLAVKADNFVVPSGMSYTAKHEWMYSGIYTDAATDKPQTYLFVPDGFFLYGLTEETDTGGTIFTSGELSYLKLMPSFGSLTGAPVNFKVGSLNPTALLTVDQLINFGNMLIDPLLQSQDINVMCGDILKAYGDSRVHKISGITETYTVYPAYDMEVLDQIQNLTFVGEYVADTVIKQDATKGWLTFTPSMQYPYAFSNETYTSPGFNAYWAKRFVSFQHGDIKPENTMEATRMTNIASKQNNDNKTLQFNTIGSEIACYGHIYYFGFGDLSLKDAEGAVWQLWRSRTLYLSNTAVIEFANAQMVVNSVNFPANTTFNINGTDITSLHVVVPELTSYAIANMQSEFNDVFRLTHMLSNFDRHPWVSVNIGMVIPQMVNETWTLKQNKFIAQIQGSTTPNTFTLVPVYGQYTGFLGDVAYYTLVDRDSLKEMSQVALLSMFNPDR